MPVVLGMELLAYKFKTLIVYFSGKAGCPITARSEIYDLERRIISGLNNESGRTPNYSVTLTLKYNFHICQGDIDKTSDFIMLSGMVVQTKSQNIPVPSPMEIHCFRGVLWFGRPGKELGCFLCPNILNSLANA